MDRKKAWMSASAVSMVVLGCATPGPRAVTPVGYEVINRSARAVTLLQTRACDGGSWTPVAGSGVAAGQRFAIPTGPQSPCVDLQALDARGEVLAEQLRVELTTGSIWSIE
jgi:hypothetical protein